ncbi:MULTISPECIES: cytochrome P450 [unclassified Crossiella]|uniref:cytochrome P450 n=1 Tax=unclassified Crossiella TaxID=2620835 RepID=UPI0020002148|nr:MULTISPECIES: cytochrome P450 [unclassified Crossiella]MCK2237467.1 cytochrome P450 [Crossiella sp. S99.2]MCK2251122.1 cytochrome P450 [Crossiella sp. S99.1]
MSAVLPSVPIAPGRVPVLGHLPAMSRDPLQFLQNLRRQGELVAFHLGARPVYLVNAPELIRQVLVTDAAKFHRGKVFRKARQLLGNGLATADNPEHHEQRRIVQPAFHRARITGYAAIMRAEIERITAAWPEGARFRLDEQMAELTLNVTAKSLFHTDFSQAAVAEIHRSLAPVLNGVTSRALLPEFLEHLPTPANRRFDEALLRLTAIVDQAIDDYRASGVDHGDLLSMLVTGEPVPDEEIRAQVLNLLMAGTETTATALSWLGYELAAHPAIADRVRAELTKVLGDRPAGPWDLPELSYVDRVITETLRLHTPVWLLMRTSVEPVRLGGADLPAGTEVLVVPPTLHRDPLLYPDPLRFDPDRWLHPEAKLWRRTRFFPFGGGAHHCVGDNFAWTEMALTVAAVYRRWDLRLAPGARVREVTRAFLKPSSVPVLATRVVTPQS